MESPAHRRHASRTDGSAEMITAAQAAQIYGMHPAQIYGHASRTDGSDGQLEIEFCM